MLITHQNFSRVTIRGLDLMLKWYATPISDLLVFSIAASRKRNDCRAFRKLTGLRNWLSGLNEKGQFIIGDNAYPIGNSLLIPFSGEEARDSSNDSYNFYLSQLRIRVEMTFGRLTSKRRIF